MAQKIWYWQTFNNSLHLCCELDLQHSNPFSQDTLESYNDVSHSESLSYVSYNDIPINSVQLQKERQFRKYCIYNKRNSHTSGALFVTLIVKILQQSNPSHGIPADDGVCCITIPSLVTKDSVAQQYPLFPPLVHSPKMAWEYVHVCVCVCVCVCVDGMNLKYALYWHINIFISVPSVQCQCKNTHSLVQKIQ